MPADAMPAAVSQAGAEVLLTVAGKFAADLPSLTIAAEIARGHHERWDGNGYPDMLAGADILITYYARDAARALA